jgi:hypothetical protein
VNAAALARSAPALPAAADGSLVLLRVSGPDQLHQAAAFRKGIFRDRRRVTFDEVLEARRDRAGHLFLLLCDGRPAATARVLPRPSPWSALGELVPGLGALAVDSEVGRIAAVPSPEGVRYSLALLALGAAWLVEHTDLRRYAAYCHPKLLDLYRLAGAEVVGGPCAVPGRSDAHFVIAGRYEDAATLAPGWSSERSA